MTAQAETAKASTKFDLTQEILHSILSYSTETGLFHWTSKMGVSTPAGKQAGYRCPVGGYIYIGYKGTKHRAHRLAFFYMTGEWPADEVDHINTICDDNRWCNLREATHQENMQNKHRMCKNNTSGAMGVSRSAASSSWLAQIDVNGVRKLIGRYSTIAEASDAYQEAKRMLHPAYVPPRITRQARQMKLGF